MGDLETAWREFVAHEQTRPVETDAECELRTSNQIEAWGQSAFFTNTTRWQYRQQDLKKKLEEVYESSTDVPERERRLVAAAMKTSCCCNTDSAAYAWCSVNWGM